MKTTSLEGSNSSNRLYYLPILAIPYIQSPAKWLVSKDFGGNVQLTFQPPYRYQSRISRVTCKRGDKIRKSRKYIDRPTFRWNNDKPVFSSMFSRVGVASGRLMGSQLSRDTRFYTIRRRQTYAHILACLFSRLDLSWFKGRSIQLRLRTVPLHFVLQHEDKDLSRQRGQRSDGLMALPGNYKINRDYLFSRAPGVFFPPCTC